MIFLIFIFTMGKFYVIGIKNINVSNVRKSTYSVAQMVKNLPAMQETWIGYPSQEDPLEKGMGTHSIILAQRIPWTEEPDRGLFATPAYSLRSQRVRDTTKQINISLQCQRKGNS